MQGNGDTVNEGMNSMDVSLRITSLFTSDRLRDLQGSDIVQWQGPFCRLALSRVGARCSIESNSESKPLRTIASMPGAAVMQRARPVFPSTSGSPKGHEPTVIRRSTASYIPSSPRAFQSSWSRLIKPCRKASAERATEGMFPYSTPMRSMVLVTLPHDVLAQEEAFHAWGNRTSSTKSSGD